MDTNSAVPENNPDSNTTMICDITQCPSAIKYFCLNLYRYRKKLVVCQMQ